MDLGFIVPPKIISGDDLLVQAAQEMRKLGLSLAGVVQHNPLEKGAGRCEMVLEILRANDQLLISQDLGPMSKGCRLNASALEQAVGLVMISLAQQKSDMLIINKFGKQEVDGRGFRPAIAMALEEEVPVLVMVRPESLQNFQDFIGDMGQEIVPDLQAIMLWVKGVLGR
jgi:nucleoside-triphosphatase THEP1